MRKPRVVLLVVIAVAVLIFDWWYLFGGSGTDSAVEKTLEDMFVDDEDDYADTPREEPPAWAAWDQWIAANKRPARDGSLNPGLMVREIVAAPVVATREPSAATPTFGVSVILWHETDPTALVNGSVVRPGDSVDGFVVGRVERDRVVLVKPFESTEWVLELQPSSLVRGDDNMLDDDPGAEAPADEEPL